MATETATDPVSINPLDPEPPPAALVRRHRGWFFALGAAQLIAGTVALIMTAAATLLTVVVIGSLALAGAAVEAASTMWSRAWQEGLAHMLVALLYGAFGMVVLANPGLAASTLTLVLAVLLLVNGAVRFGLAVTGQFRGWGMAAVGGALSALLGGLIWADWPENSLWVIGLFVGLDLVVMGAYWIAAALTDRAPTAAAV